ncbi:AAA family ATPase [Paeniglutamicibacter sp. NPDC091659]|uniref:AAA family ATPase n=1 Tax=Paeniglutamicibacter sp. NPDC091659 TaxID=3364389 RepID=UPI0038016CE1
MRKIYVVNEKGGVGKSTITFHLAGALAQHGTTVLVDADRQETSYRYYTATENALKFLNQAYVENLADFEAGSRRRKPVMPAQEPSFGAIVYPHATSSEQIEAQCANFDYMIVDTSAGINRDLLNSIMNSDSLVLIPCDTKMSDLWTTSDLVKAYENSKATIRIVQREGQQPRAYAAEELQDAGLAHLTIGSVISTLNAYEDSIRNGGTVMDVPLMPSDRPLQRARTQVTKLATEVVSILSAIEKEHAEVAGGQQATA